MAKKGMLISLLEWIGIVGLINWGLVAIGFNLVEWIADLVTLSWVSTIIYAIVGIEGIRQLVKKFS